MSRLQFPKLAPLPDATSPKPPLLNPEGTGELIMLVDDDAAIRRAAGMVLAFEGYRVITSADGFEAVAHYQAHQDQVALVVMDFTMPKMNGADAYLALRQINPKVAVILSSAAPQEIPFDAMFRHGLLDFLPKPYTGETLLALVRTTLDTLNAPRRP